MNRMQVYRACIAVLAAAACGAAARAEHTREWRQSSYEDFLKGTAHGLAVRSDGKLELAPKFTQIADADASYLWSIRMDPKGTVYAAGGTPAKVFRLDANGKLNAVFDSTELSAQAIAFDAKGTLYVGTSPDGKVYRVSSSGEKSVFFDPKTKYIWDMAFGPDGTLYVATGDKGQIFAVSPEGKGEVFYASDEAHIRVLAFDGKGNLIAGTEPSGRVLRLTKKTDKSTAKDGGAEGFVLYETPKREVTALAVGQDGSIYASAIGERAHTAAQVSTTVVTGAVPQATTTVTAGGNIAVIGPTSGVVQGPSPFVPFPPLLTGSVYKISPEGAPEELWSSRDEVVYSLAVGADGRLLAGTGNNGTVLAIDGRGVFAQVAKAGSAQVTGILGSAAGKTYLCMANPGKIAQLGPDYEQEGTFESRSFDAQLFSQWGRLDWWSGAEAAKKAGAEASRLEFFVRSGNTEDPGKEWSRWFGPYAAPGSAVEAPAARFVQWKAVIHNGKPGDGIQWVSLAYEPHNVAPVIDGIALQDPGVRAMGIPVANMGRESAALRTPPAQSGAGTVVVSQGTTKFDNPAQGFKEKGWQSVLWSAHDDNDDDLRYAVYFRGENEKQWKLLKDKLEQKYFALDTTSLADGAYYLKIVAEDAESNPPAEAKQAERESERFVVDNTPPSIEKLEVSVTGRSGNPATATAHVTFAASDGASAIDRAQYSVDGGDWILLAPKSGISDSKAEAYDFSVNGLSAGEHTIAVRAYDQFENVGSGKATVTVTGARP